MIGEQSGFRNGSSPINCSSFAHPLLFYIYSKISNQKVYTYLTIPDKKINKVACGSAHSLAWSTNKPTSTGKLPQKIPLECDRLKDMNMLVLRNRYALLHHFSDLFCPTIPMFDIAELHTPSVTSGDSAADRTLGGSYKLRGLLISSGKVRLQ